MSTLPRSYAEFTSKVFAENLDAQPLYERLEGAQINQDEQHYDIGKLQEIYDKNKQEIREDRKSEWILDMCLKIKPEINKEQQEVIIRMEKKFIREIVASDLHKRHCFEVAYMPSYAELKKRYFLEARIDKEHICILYKNLPKGFKIIPRKNTSHGPLNVIQTKEATGNVFICVQCGRYHICTPEKCDSRIFARNNEAIVCSVSGRDMGVVTAIPDPIRTFHYSIEAGQDVTETHDSLKKVKNILATTGTTILSKRNSKSIARKQPTSKRPKRNTFKTISNSYLNPTKTSSKNTASHQKTLDAIKIVVADTMLPHNFYDLCSKAISQRVVQGLKKTKTFITQGNYTHVGDVFSVFVTATYEDITTIMTIRDSHELITHDMIVYFSKCIFSAFKIISKAPNAETMQGTKNLTFVNTIVSLLYQMQKGLSSMICVTTPENIYLHSDIERFPVRRLGPGDICGMHDVTPENFEIGGPYCEHILLEMIPKHKILENLLLPQELLKELELISPSVSVLSKPKQVSFSTAKSEKRKKKTIVKTEPERGPRKKKAPTNTAIQITKTFISILSHPENLVSMDCLEQYLLKNHVDLDPNFL
jgi:hypothetical protein